MFRGDGTLTPVNMGSPYGPMDSWVYPAFDRLAAIGYVKSGMFGMRPWTRLECARLLNESEDHGTVDDSSSEAARINLELAKEFSGELREMSGGENTGAKGESVYARVTGISGQPLTDGFHFGETIINDYGRPFHERLNSALGISPCPTPSHFFASSRT